MAKAPENKAREKSSDNKTIGITFMIAGLGLMISLGISLGWVFASAGIGLLVVGFVYFTMKDGEK